MNSSSSFNNSSSVSIQRTAVLKYDPPMMDLTDQLRLRMPNLGPPSLHREFEVELNSCFQPIIEWTQDENFEFFCPYAIRRKMLSLYRCPIDNNSCFEDRVKFMRIAISIGHRVAYEFLVKNSDSHKIISSLWVNVRNRGCQFLGPAIQEEVLKLIILALGDGAQLTRKVLVLYILQKIQKMYPIQATKTSVGHVVQILYRASCFELIKRQGVSCLMQLKEQFRQYEDLRREHDAQIVSIALDSGIRLSPEQWSSLLYGDSVHKSHMQSIIDKLNATNPPFNQMLHRLYETLTENGDPVGILNVFSHFKTLLWFEANIDKDSNSSFCHLCVAVNSTVSIVAKLVIFIKYCYRQNGTFSLFKNPNRNHFI